MNDNYKLGQEIVCKEDMREIPSVLEINSGLLNELVNGIDLLYGKLGPISISRVCENGSEKPKENVYRTEFAQRIDMINDTLKQAIFNINDMRNSIQL